LIFLVRISLCNAGLTVNRNPIETMDAIMIRFALFLLLSLLGATVRLAAEDAVERRGITSEVKLEEVVFGHLTELNGKYKMRATEVTFAPGGYLGVHLYVGPGVRYVLSGELTFNEGGRATVYRAGDYFFETGNLAHTGENKTNEPLRILFVEMLPKNWSLPRSSYLRHNEPLVGISGPERTRRVHCQIFDFGNEAYKHCGRLRCGVPRGYAKFPVGCGRKWEGLQCGGPFS